MYIPGSFRVDDPDALRDFVSEHAFGTIFTHGPDGPFATHLPFALDPTLGPNGTLVSHMARANPHWRSFDGREGLVTFLGPHVYVSPTWYAAAEAVPTWNYQAVHARGVPTVVEDPARLRTSLERLVAKYESPPDGWSIERMGALVERLLPAIVGFEMPIAWIGGKFKLNQNRSEDDRRGVIEALTEAGTDDARALAARMAEGLDAPEGA